MSESKQNNKKSLQGTLMYSVKDNKHYVTMFTADGRIDYSLRDYKPKTVCECDCAENDDMRCHSAIMYTATGQLYKFCYKQLE
jgi:hypothetical protein